MSTVFSGVPHSASGTIQRSDSGESTRGMNTALSGEEIPAKQETVSWLLDLKAVLKNVETCSVCAHTHIYIYIYIYISIYIYTYISVYVCMYVCTYVRMYVCTYVPMYLCTYVRMYVCTYVRTDVRTYVQM